MQSNFRNQIRHVYVYAHIDEVESRRLFGHLFTLLPHGILQISVDIAPSAGGNMNFFKLPRSFFCN